MDSGAISNAVGATLLTVTVAVSVLLAPNRSVTCSPTVMLLGPSSPDGRELRGHADRVVVLTVAVEVPGVVQRIVRQIRVRRAARVEWHAPALRHSVRSTGFRHGGFRQAVAEVSVFDHVAAVDLHAIEPLPSLAGETGFVKGTDLPARECVSHVKLDVVHVAVQVEDTACRANPACRWGFPDARS